MSGRHAADGHIGWLEHSIGGIASSIERAVFTEELARQLDPSGSGVAGRILEALVIQLVQQDAISSGKGAELLGMPKQDFRRLLRERGVPYMDITEEELRAELEAAAAYAVGDS